MATYDLGDGVPLRHLVYDRAGALTDASVALGINKPDGSTVSVTVTRTSLGVYDANVFIPDQVGIYDYVWTVSGAVTDVKYGTFYVAATAPANYTTVDLVKESLSKDTDDERDDLIELAVQAASRKIDQITGRRFYADRTATTRVFPLAGRVFAAANGSAVLIDDIASLTSLALEAGSMSTFAAVSTFYPGPENALAYGRPVTYLQIDPVTLASVSSIRVTARWGWPVVPDEVALATQLLAARLYRRKDSPQGVVGAGFDGVSIRVSRVDPDVESLIGNFILPGFA